MLKQYIDVIRWSSDLSETVLEGLQYIQVQLKEGYFEYAIKLFEDIITAHYQIEKSIQLFVDKLSTPYFEQLGKHVHESLDQIVTAFEQGEREILSSLIQVLLPHYINWKQELQQSFRPYILL